jgi:hypothetical protein
MRRATIRKEVARRRFRRGSFLGAGYVTLLLSLYLALEGNWSRARPRVVYFYMQLILAFLAGYGGRVCYNLPIENFCVRKI